MDLKNEVYIVSNMYPDEQSPNYGVFVQRTVRQIQDEFRCRILVIRGKSRFLHIKLIKYIFFYTKLFFVFFCSKQTLFYVHYANHSLIPLSLFSSRRLRNVVLNFHGGDLFPENRISKIIKPLTRRVVCSAGSIIVPSKYFQDEVSKAYSIPKEKIFIYPSGGVDRCLFSPDSTEQFRELRKKVVIGYVGRLDPGKGFELLFEAFRALCCEGLDLELRVVGGGRLLQQFERSAKDSCQNNQVHFYGMLAHHELPSVMREFDVFVFPSTRKGESLGLVGVEALSCGIPVIGSDLGGISTYIVDGYNGYLFEPGDDVDLIRALKRFVRLSSQDRLEMKKNARKSSSVFDQEDVRKDLILYLRQHMKLFIV